jgi:hypothetical protein
MGSRSHAGGSEIYPLSLALLQINLPGLLYNEPA